LEGTNAVFIKPTTMTKEDRGRGEEKKKRWRSQGGRKTMLREVQVQGQKKKEGESS